MHLATLPELCASKRRFLALLGLTAALWLGTAGKLLSAASGVTIAVTGDIYTAEAKVVSDVILAHPAVTAVLLAGDTNNGSKTPIESYRELYRGTYDRFWDKLRPAPGNHDEHSTPPFSAYREFWGAAAHVPEQYYSFDLGGWHIVSLDSMTFIQGGAAADAQLAWLKRDLAAHPGKPVVAYWHHPYFSNAKHNGQAKTKPFWDALFAHGPALAFGGHNHVYERFAPLSSDGKPVPEHKGIRQFVIGPGGAKPVEKESEKAQGPPSEKFHGGTHHVGFFTLHADGGYSFVVQGITGKGVTTVVDRGAGNLLRGPHPGAD